MNIQKYKDFKEIFGNPELPLEHKIHLIESDISQIFYRILCRITGGKFDIRKTEGQKICFLVTKRGFHPISNFLAKRKNGSIEPSTLEVYERNCMGNRWKGVRIMSCYRWFENDSNCEDCGKSYKVQEDDIKIVGKF